MFLLKILKKANYILSLLEDVVETGVKRRRRQQANRYIAKVEKIRVDLGCGSVRRAGFIGIDLSKQADIQWDIRWGIPFPDESVSEIRSDHFFEHLELSTVVYILEECYRVLLPNGLLDFSVPHFNPYLDAYIQRDFEFMRNKIFDIPKGQDDLYATCFDRIAWLLHRNCEHKSLFDRDSIIHKVKFAGFSDVKIREYDESRDISRRFSSIYVVATK